MMKHVHNEAFARHVEEHFEERRKITKHSTLECQAVVQTDNNVKMRIWFATLASGQFCTMNMEI